MFKSCSSLYIADINVLSHQWLAEMFSHALSCFSTLMLGFFFRMKLYNFTQSHFSILWDALMLLESFVEDHPISASISKVLPLFFSRIFKVSCLCSCSTYFESIFVQSVGCGSIFSLLHEGNSTTCYRDCLFCTEFLHLCKN